MDVEEIDRNARQRLKLARIASGKHPDQLCRYTANSTPAYYDVENCDGDLTDCLNLQDVKGLCAELGVSVRSLFGDQSRGPLLSPEIIVQKIQDHMAANSLSLESLEDEVGCYLAAALKNPPSIWKDWNVACLRSVCRVVSLNWVEVFG